MMVISIFHCKLPSTEFAQNCLMRVRVRTRARAHVCVCLHIIFIYTCMYDGMRARVRVYGIRMIHMYFIYSYASGTCTLWNGAVLQNVHFYNEALKIITRIAASWIKMIHYVFLLFFNIYIFLYISCLYTLYKGSQHTHKCISNKYKINFL